MNDSSNSQSLKRKEKKKKTLDFFFCDDRRYTRFQLGDIHIIHEKI